MTLIPRIRARGEFKFGSWSWSYLLDIAGPVLGPMWHQGSRWYRVDGVDPRYKNPDYPESLGDSGQSFYVRAAEARQLANVARNWAIIQRSLGPEYRTRDDNDRVRVPEPWPLKVRDDWPPLFEAFADWAERSGGFTV
jgi:hypothetical protein